MSPRSHACSRSTDCAAIVSITTTKGPRMFRQLLGFAMIAAFAIGLARPQSVVQPQRGGDARARITGAWRVLSYELEFQDGSEHRFPLGAHPNDYMIFAPDGRMMAY